MRYINPKPNHSTIHLICISHVSPIRALTLNLSSGNQVKFFNIVMIKYDLTVQAYADDLRE